MVQIIKLNTTKTYYAGFLQQLLMQNDVSGHVTQVDDTIYLTINDLDVDKLSAFSQSINSNLPISLFFESMYASDVSIDAKPIQIDAITNRVCPKCLRDILSRDTPHYLNTSYMCNHYGITHTFDTTPFDTLAPKYSTEYIDDSYLLITDTSILDTLFLLSDSERQALFSYEKPILKVSISDEALQQKLNKKFVNIKIFATVYESIIAYQYKNQGYLYAKYEDEFMVFINQNKVYMLNNNDFSTPQRQYDQSPRKNLIRNIMSEYGITKGALILDLSYTDMGVYIHKPEGLARVSTLIKPISKSILKDIQTSNGKRERLIDNYIAKHKDTYDKLVALDSTNIFDFLCVLIGVDDLHDSSLEFIGNGGLKIDVKIGSDYGIDYVPLISSIISYILADVEPSLIAYSFYESIVDVVSHIIDEANKHEKKELIFVGDMLQNPALYNKINKKLSHFVPKISTKYSL